MDSDNGRRNRSLWVEHRILFVGSVLTCLCSHGSSLEPSEIAERALSAVVSVRAFDPASGLSSAGSGFLIGADVVCTNLHVIRGCSDVALQRVLGDETYSVSSILSADVENDLVLLKVQDNLKDAAALVVGKEPKIGDRIYVAGNPEGFEGTFSEGIISGIRLEGSNTRYQMTAAISAGSSGGPVLNANGDVIGVAQSKWMEGESINFAIPATYLLELQDSESLPMTVAQFATLHPAPQSTQNPSSSPSIQRPQKVEYADGRFVENGDGTTTDTKTGLIWQTGDSGEKLMKMRLYRMRWSLAGRTDWRVPTKAEFKSLELSKHKNVSLPFVTTGDARYYWFGKLGGRTGTYLWNEDEFSVDTGLSFQVRLVAGP